MKKMCVLGAGSWGTALALVLANNGHYVSLWTLSEEQKEIINIDRTNHKYLPNISIHQNIKATCNLEEAVQDAKLIVLAVPSQAIRGVCKNIKKYITSDQIIVNASKGLERETGFRMSEVVFSEIEDAKFVVLSGPSHAEEVALNLPTTIAVASNTVEYAEKVQSYFNNNNFRVYTNSDIIGVELGGTLKNIIAFGAGICDGVGYGDNTKSALITRGLAEIKKLGACLGANIETFSGLSGIGDLIVTCTSQHSRNRKAGMLIGQGKNLEETLEEVQMVVEGVVATEVAYSLSKKLGVEMPITEAIYSVLYNNVSAKKAVEELMSRDSKSEVFV